MWCNPLCQIESNAFLKSMKYIHFLNVLFGGHLFGYVGSKYDQWWCSFCLYLSLSYTLQSQGCSYLQQMEEWAADIFMLIAIQPIQHTQTHTHTHTHTHKCAHVLTMDRILCSWPAWCFFYYPSNTLSPTLSLFSLLCSLSGQFFLSLTSSSNYSLP